MTEQILIDTIKLTNGVYYITIKKEWMVEHELQLKEGDVVKMQLLDVMKKF